MQIMTQTLRRELPNFQRVAAIFPHPDDEVLTCGGVLHQYARRGALTGLCILTKGERGVEGAVFTPKLKPIREKEAQAASRVLGIKILHHDDLGDGQLARKSKQIDRHVEEFVDSFRPDLVITYDRSGLYGHPDHIATTESVLRVVQNRPKITTWLVAFPEHWLKQMSLPTHMAKNASFENARAQPTHYVFVGLSGLIKLHALNQYRSQHFGFAKNKPPGLPMVAKYFMRCFVEYYHLVPSLKN